MFEESGEQNLPGVSSGDFSTDEGSPRRDVVLTLCKLSQDLRRTAPDRRQVYSSLRFAVRAIGRLLPGYGKFSLSGAPGATLMDGQPLTRQDILGEADDLLAFFRAAGLVGITLLPGVEEVELLQCFRAINSHAKGAPIGAQLRLNELQLEHIVLLRSDGEPIKASPQAPAADPRDALSWNAYLSRMRKADNLERVRTMSELATWISRQGAHMSPVAAEHIDALLVEMLDNEKFHPAIFPLLSGVEFRSIDLASAREWKRLAPLLIALKRRAATHTEREGAVAARRVQSHVAHEVVKRLLQNDAEEDGSPRDVIAILSREVGTILIGRLQYTTVISERKAVIRRLEEYGALLQHVMIAELRAPHAWFVTRNLLTVLGNIGSREALGAIADRMRHPDGRVRAEAVAAAAHIARDKAGPYLLQGLHDPDEEVRAAAAAHAGACRKPAVLNVLRRILRSSHETDNVQVAACVALGEFDADIARDILQRIIAPSRFGSYRNKGDIVRATAIVAATRFKTHPLMEKALRRALQDPNPVIRRAAQNALEAGGE